METIKGTVVKLIYQNPDNWYSVCDVEADNGKLITVVGIMPYIAVGEGISAVGSWITSKDYGQQFKVEEYEKILPQKKNEILRYLASGAVKGIGAKIAQKIVEIYGEDSFDVIANHPDWLVNIRGISRKKAYEISIDFKEKSDVREILTFCNGTISSNTAVKVYKKWGRNALGIIQDNPYTLCSGDFGIGFKRADEIALGLGFDPSRDERIISGIRYALEIFASRDGHIYVFEDKLCDGVSKLLEVDKNKVVEILNNGTVLDFVHIDSSFKGDNGETQKRVSLRALYNAEQYIAKKLTDINKRAIYLDDANIEHIVHRIELQNGIEYAKMQRLAILKCVNNGVTVLTGGPGTGKTTIIKAVLQIFSNFGLKCALCAPTGRASKRMSEATGCDAKTIHRLLEVSVNDFDGVPKFQRDDKNHLDEDVIIIDESSMIDVSLMNSLLLAIKPGARLILIGDTNQLPSVGEGNVLNDIIKSECFCTVRLTEIFRQARDSGIVINAHKINKGEHPDLTQKFDDFFFISVAENNISEYVADLCKTRLPRKYNETVFDGIQIITPQKKGVNGTYNLNYVLQEKLNPSTVQKNECNTARERKIRLGDRIMQIKNNYEAEWETKNGENGMGVFNGDVGIVKQIYNDEKRLVVDYGDRSVSYQFSSLDELDHSYAITVHKSQGSEYPIVIIPLSSSCPPMLQTRNLIYTAITRASRMVIIVGDKNTFFNMIDNDMQQIRNTYLEAFLKKVK